MGGPGQRALRWHEDWHGGGVGCREGAGRIQKGPQEPGGASGVCHGLSGKPSLGPGQRVCGLIVTLRSARCYAESGCRQTARHRGRGRGACGCSCCRPLGRWASARAALECEMLPVSGQEGS